MRRIGFALFLILSVSIATLSACGGGGGGGGGTAPAQNLAVALRGTGQIAIVDLSNYAIAATYNVGTGLKTIDISPDKQLFYATDNPGGSGATETILWVVNVGTGAIADSIDLGGRPWGVKVHPDGSKAYVTLGRDDLLAVVDLATNSVASTIGLPVGGRAVGLDISPDGSVVCVANNWDDSISFVNTASQAVSSVGPIGTGGNPWDVAISPDGNECWAGDGEWGDTVSVFSTSTHALAATIKLSIADTSGANHPMPNPIVFTPDGNRVFVAGKRTAELMVLDPATYTQTGTILTSATGIDFPKHLVADFDSKRLFLSSDNNDYISVIDLTTDTEVNFINFPTGARPNGMVLY